VTGVQGDVANLEDIDRLCAQIAQEKGRIDILFANAGIASQNALMGQITELQFDLTFGITSADFSSVCRRRFPSCRMALLSS
jgi:NAD(P)-dependent dehydrogenase (short-subunit alcohol dehydrogenase family)